MMGKLTAAGRIWAVNKGRVYPGCRGVGDSEGDMGVTGGKEQSRNVHGMIE